jgi:hypothetical protein
MNEPLFEFSSTVSHRVIKTADIYTIGYFYIAVVNFNVIVRQCIFALGEYNPNVTYENSIHLLEKSISLMCRYIV